MWLESKAEVAPITEQGDCTKSTNGEKTTIIKQVEGRKEERLQMEVTARSKAKEQKMRGRKNRPNITFRNSFQHELQLNKLGIRNFVYN